MNQCTVLGLVDAVTRQVPGDSTPVGTSQLPSLSAFQVGW